jgi:hypothetical protein
MKMTLTNLIGNEKQKDEDLLAIARKNSTIRDVLTQKKANPKKAINIEYRNEEYVTIASRLVSGVENGLGKKSELFRINELISFTHDKYLLAIDKFLLGKQDEAKEIFDKIETKRKFGLIKDDHGKQLDHPGLWSHDSFLASIAHSLIGRNDAAKSISAEYIYYAEKNIGYDTSGLINAAYIEKGNTSKLKLSAYDNLLLCIAKGLSLEEFPINQSSSYLSEGSDLLAKVWTYFNSGTSIAFGDSLISTFKYSTIPIVADTRTNTMYAVAKYMYKRFVPEQIMKDIDKQIGHKTFYSNGFVIADLMKRDIYKNTFFADDTLSYAFAYLTLAGALDNFIKTPDGQKWKID